MSDREDIPGIPTAPSAPAIIGTSRPALAAGQVLAGRYEIRGRLGAGGMGSVWRTYDRELEEEIALKVILPERGGDRPTLDRFRREVKIARRISHPNICRMFDYGEAEGLCFLTMELVEGRTLRAHLAAGPLTPERALNIARQVAEGLAAAHMQGVIHRDLKPENVILREDGRAVVVDFGLARSAATEHTSVATIAGTPTYMSPEQLRGEALDVRSDVFAIGLLSAELLTGRSPFEQGSLAATTSAILRDPPRPLDVPSLPRMTASALDAVIGRALAKAPEDRFPSASELAAALASVQGGALSSSDVKAYSQPYASRHRTVGRLSSMIRSRGALAAAVALLTIAGAFAISPAVRRLGAPDVQPAATKTVAPAEPPVDAPPTVLVLLFENLSAEPALDDLCRSAVDSLRVGIRKLPGLQMLDAPPAGTPMAEAERRRATWIVTGSVQRLGRELRLVAQIRVASGQAVGEPIEVDGDPAQPAVLLDRLRQRALDEMWLLGQEHDRERRAIRGTQSEIARTKLLQYYAMIGPAPAEEHLQVGKRLLDETIEADGAYVSALVERAYLQARGAGATKFTERLSAGLSDLDRALAAAPASAPALVMRCRLLQASLEAEGNPTDAGIARALDACGAALQADPSSAHVRLVLARLYDRTCRDDEAMASLEKAYELDRSLGGRSLKHLGELALSNDKLQFADRVTRDLVGLQDEERQRGARALSQRAGVPPISAAHLLRAAVLLRLGRLVDARAAFERQLEDVSLDNADKRLRNEDNLTEASALRGLLRIMVQVKEAPPAGAEARLGTLEAVLRAAAQKDPRAGLNVAGAYQWTDPTAVVGWLDIAGDPGGAMTCDDAFRRALFYSAAGRRKEAQQALDRCKPNQRWEQSCVGWVRARMGR
jgi:tetratricopeptide (TPR) repeat protein/TolB-like protein